jgi:drug/metabolite transporter (DMT)-like permease
VQATVAVEDVARSALRRVRIGQFLCWVGVTAFSVTLPTQRYAVRELSPWFVSMGRAVVAAALATIALAIARLPFPTRAELRPLIGVAFGVVIGFPGCSTLAVKHIPSAHAAVTNGLLPLATVGLAVAIAGERPTRRWWFATVLGVAALVVFALYTGGSTVSVGHPLMLAAVGLAAIGYVNGGVLSRTRPGWWVISWGLIVALPVTTTVAALNLPTHRPPAMTWLAFGYLSAVSMFLGFFAWYAGLARAGFARGGQIQLLQPIESFFWAAVLLSESIGVAELLAGGAVIAALAIGRRRT